MISKAKVVSLMFMASGVTVSYPVLQCVQSLGRLAGDPKHDELRSTVFSQYGPALYTKQGVHTIPQVVVAELAAYLGKQQQQRDLTTLTQLPRCTRTFHFSFLHPKLSGNLGLSFTTTGLRTRFGGSPSTHIHQYQQRAYHTVVNGLMIGAVVQRNKTRESLKQVDDHITVHDTESQKCIETQDVQEPAEEGERLAPIEAAQSTSTDPPTDCYITEFTYPAGLPWRAFPIKDIRFREGENERPSHSDLLVDLKARRRSLLQTLATSQSVTEAWEAYSNLLHFPDDVAIGEPRVPFAHMHRLCRVLARHRPKTRKQFLRLLSVLTAIKEAGGEIKLHEWNALIDGAGKGWRRTSIDDFRTSLGIYQNMITGRMPGKSSARDQEEENEVQTPPVKPDIYTYTTLISIASRTLHATAFRYATSLLASSGLAPNRITHLSLLTYFTFTKQLSGVRSTLLKMQEQNLELGLDGVNACLWSYGHNGRVDLVMMVYRLFRHNISPEISVGEDDVASIAHRLRVEEHIVIPPDMKPNEVTFTTVIQILAHHGNLLATLSVFMDMMSSQNLEMGAPLVPDENGILKPTPYSPTLPVFRAIFLGFSRHGVCLMKDGTAPPRSRAANPLGQPAWSLTNLRALFDTFLTLPEHTIVSRSTIYWIMVAFEKTSGNDVALLRQVWKQLETRFKSPCRGPNDRLGRIQGKLFPREGRLVDKRGHKV